MLTQYFSRIHVITHFISEEALGFTQRRQCPGAAEQGRKGRDLTDPSLCVEAQGELLQLVPVGAGKAGGAPACACPLAFPFPQAAGAMSLAVQGFPARCTPPTFSYLPCPCPF